MKQLGETMFVSGQIAAEDVPAIASQGVTMIVNNRPDGEESGQPPSSEIEAAARAANLTYREIPISGGFSDDQVQAMAEALDAAEGKVLAFCRSGTRSTYLWALARAQSGDDSAEITQRAATAGYDLSPIAAYLRR